jgi:hypothetical protein
VQKTTSCWEWEGRKNQDGYGEFDLDKSFRAHRVSYELFRGEIPPELNVCHSCDNPSCVNPDHLWLGTQLENNQDRHKKGRSKGGSGKGFDHNQSKLTPEQVRAIRFSTAPLAHFAEEFNVSLATVSRVRNNKVYKNT